MFGCFVALVAFIPSAIVTYQWLTGTTPTGPHTDPAAAIPGMAIVLWGLAVATARAPVTVDGRAGTLTFRRAVFGVTYHTEVWRRDEIQAIEMVHRTYSQQGWGAYLHSDRGNRALLDYSHRADPDQVRETARLLGIPVRYPDDPQRQWRE